mmetsp:Transcript_6596/g.10030  ORF Transcript_6596/g.10030 Transcript_6596/m.10030 type:complete len:411 (+) Transcript_6596:90-1322(+)
MSSGRDNNNNGKQPKKPSTPSFAVDPVAVKIKLSGTNDGVEEVTRRVGGGPGTAVAAPRFANPSFNPIRMAALSPTLNIQQNKPQIQPTQAQQRISTQPSGWKINDAPTLPEFHPLERTAVFVPNASVPDVASRISNVLRERSIQATYDNSKAKAKCMTVDQVDFRIRLYRGRNQYSHGIIVEVQRRFGASLNFQSDTTAILHAAQGIEDQIPPPPTSLGLPVVSDTEDETDSERSMVSLQIVANMLRSPVSDAYYLALQTLSSLTDPIKIGHSTAFKASVAMLEPDNEVGDNVISFVVDAKLDPEETFGLRVLAMTCLSNAISVTNGQLSTILQEKLRPVLFTELKNVNDNPQMAYLAAKCFYPLISQAQHNYTELYTALENAKSVGNARHAALAREAERCLQRLDNPR